MAQSAKLQLRQSQGLALTPQLMQSIKLLQMSALELENFVQSEIEKNPLLELDPNAQEFPDERRQQVSEKSDTEKPDSGEPSEIDGRSNDWEVSAVEERLGTSLENVFDTETSKSSQDNSKPLQGVSNSSGAEQEYSASINDVEAYLPSRESLRDFLLQQAVLAFRDQRNLKIAREIIDLIDGDGYLRSDLKNICKVQNASAQEVAEILSSIQKFDPPGVGARTLSECMQLQLAEKNRLDPAMKLFTENLGLLAKRDYVQLSKICGVDHQDLIDMALEIKVLSPRPGEAFNPAPVQNVVPDVFINAKSDGSWIIELNSFTLPKVLINREYYAEIKNLSLEKADKKFMIDNLQSANWLVASLDQRAQTILKVATEIVKQQDMFFVKGVEHLKPLNLKTVAEQIGMHESTVSRVSRNKFLTCERGIFEFKYFFMSGIEGKDGKAGVGGQSIRAKIRNLINAETGDSVLSDEKIVELLGQDDIKIARRTVTKYRESMGILSSIQRRREFKALAN